MAELATTLDVGRVYIGKAIGAGLLPGETLTHLAVGTGLVLGVDAKLIKPPKSDKGLGIEIGRAFYTTRQYVTENIAGSIVVGAAAYAPSTKPTNLIYFLFRYLAAEAQGDWTEFALYGDGVAFISRGATLVDVVSAGDDLANFQVILGGAFIEAESQTVSVTVTTGGGSGVAEIDWSSTGSIASAAGQVVTLGSPVAIGGGVTLTFDGGADAVLTVGDAWNIVCTRDPLTQVFAAGGLYDGATNEGGQVRIDGTPVRKHHVDPPFVKGASTVDIRFVAEILNPEPGE